MIKKCIGISIAAISAIGLSGCGKSVQPPLYTWGNYVNSSAKYGMYGHEKDVVENHRAELKKIIDDSEQNKQRVAPGIYAEYAQLLYQTNQKEEAKHYFQLEKRVYPESRVFIDRVCMKLYGVVL